MTLEFKKNITRSNFQLGDVIVVPKRDILINHDCHYELEPLVMVLLCILAEKPGEVMMRDTLINRLWNLDNGGDENLTRAISVLRKSLKNATEDENFIETIPKRGYRLTHPVSKLNPSNMDVESSFNAHDENHKVSFLPTAIIIFLISIPVIIIIAISS